MSKTIEAKYSDDLIAPVWAAHVLGLINSSRALLRCIAHAVMFQAALIDSDDDDAKPCRWWPSLDLVRGQIEAIHSYMENWAPSPAGDLFPLLRNVEALQFAMEGADAHDVECLKHADVQAVLLSACDLLDGIDEKFRNLLQHVERQASAGAVPGRGAVNTCAH